MSIGESILGLLGNEDPRRALLQAIASSGQQGQPGAPYATQPAQGAGTAAAPQADAAGAQAQQAQPQAYQSPPDISSMYNDLLRYRARENNINLGVGLIGAGMAQPDNRAGVLNAFAGSNNSGLDGNFAAVAEMAQNINKQRIAQETRAAQLAALPGIASKYGIDLATAKYLFDTGQLDKVISEQEKPNNELVTSGDGTNILIDKTNNRQLGAFGVPKPQEYEKTGDANGQTIIYDPRTGKEVSRLGTESQNIKIVDGPDGAKYRVDEKTGTNYGKVLDGDMSTEDTKNYGAYVSDELKRGNDKPMSLQEWRMTKPPSTRITNNLTDGSDPSLKKFGEKSGEYFAEDYQNLRKSRNQARDMMNQYDLAEQGLATGVNTGAFGETEQALRKIGQAMGIDTDPKKIAGGELVKTVTNRMALIMRNPESGMGMPGSVSDRDLTFLKDAQVGLSASEAGNKTMLEAFRRLERRKIEVADLADAYVKKHKQLDAGFDAEVKAYAEANPLFEGLEVGPTLSREERLKAAREKYGRKPQ